MLLGMTNADDHERSNRARRLGIVATRTACRQKARREELLGAIDRSPGGKATEEETAVARQHYPRCHRRPVAPNWERDCADLGCQRDDVDAAEWRLVGVGIARRGIGIRNVSARGGRHAAVGPTTGMPHAPVVGPACPIDTPQADV